MIAIFNDLENVLIRQKRFQPNFIYQRGLYLGGYILEVAVWQDKKLKLILCLSDWGNFLDVRSWRVLSIRTRNKNLSPCLSDWGKFLEVRSWRRPVWEDKRWEADVWFCGHCVPPSRLLLPFDVAFLSEKYTTDLLDTGHIFYRTPGFWHWLVCWICCIFGKGYFFNTFEVRVISATSEPIYIYNIVQPI